MNTSELADRLFELTASWQPSGAATQQDLREARLYLADGFLSGIAPQQSQLAPAFRTSVTAFTRPEIDAAARLAKSSTNLMPYVRSTADIDHALSASVVGMQVSETLGPFVDFFGVTHWVDLIPLPQKVPIVSSTHEVLGYIIIAAPGPHLGPGSLWIATKALGLTAAINNFVGLSFSAGSAKEAGDVKSSGGTITIGAGGTVTLDLKLSPPTPKPGLPGLGLDAVQMSLSLPKQVTIEFTETVVTFVTIDSAAATVYGTSCTLTRTQAPPQFLELAGGVLKYALFPCDISIAQFAFQSVLSADIKPAGQSNISAGGWAIPVTTARPQQLGAASSAGNAILQLGSGLSLLFDDLQAPALLASATLALAPGLIRIIAVNGTRDIIKHLTLWDATPAPASLQPTPSQCASELVVTTPRAGLLIGHISGQEEDIFVQGRVRAKVDRPLTSNGSRLGIAFSSALIVFRHATTKAVIVGMLVPDLSPGGSQAQAVLALENALLRIGPATAGGLFAQYSGPSLVGSLEFEFDSVQGTPIQITPMLADPYAAGDVSELPFSGSLTALITWTPQAGPVLRFGRIAPSASSATTQIASSPGRVFGPTTLLDLSGNADQFGVSVVDPNQTLSQPALDGMAIALRQDVLELYTLPGISWEPVVDQSTGDWLNAQSTDDGPPTTLRAWSEKTVNLVRVEPNIVLPAFAAQASANADTRGKFTLPFGLVAQLVVNPPPDTPANQRPSYSLIKANYAGGVTAARQLSIRPQAVINVGDPALPGTTTTGAVPPPSPPQTSQVYGVLTLGIEDYGAGYFFDQEFSGQASQGSKPEIPVSRIDISGYGTSMFSDWKDRDLDDVGVRRARFDVLVGRTAYELVQIASVIVPWYIRVTRTIIFERYNTGLVVRQDTGWKATGNGEFEKISAGQKLLGPVEFLENVHNIHASGGQTIKSNGLEFGPVTFDADIMMGPSVTAMVNGAMTRLVPGTQIQGYLQLTPGKVIPGISMLAMMQQSVPDGVFGSVACVLNIGSAPAPGTPKFTLNVSSLTAKTASVSGPGVIFTVLALGLYGTPRLPRDGAWSITRRAQNDATPTAVDPTFPIPLIFGSNNDGNYQWRLLDPVDALSANTPSTTFGLLQGTGTSKTLFENPVIATSGQSLLLDPNRGVPSPQLADIGSLLGASGIFPNLAKVLQIPAKPTDSLQLVQDGFSKSFPWTISKNDGTPLDDQTLLENGAVHIKLQYQDTRPQPPILAKATFTVDAAPPAGQPRWSLKIDNLAAAVFVDDFGNDALLTIHGSFNASELEKAGFKDIKIDYGNALNLITGILNKIKDLVTAIGGTVNLDVGFSDNKLTIRDGFALPTVPLGLGELEHIAINMGLAIEIPSSAEFTVALASKEDPFTWIVDPLTGNGTIVLGTSGGEMGVFIEAGIGLALALSVAVASGSASIMVDFSVHLQAPDVQLSLALTGNANVDILGGVASASLTLTASITVDVHPKEADFYGAVAVGIHISIAWVVSVDFDGDWSFSQAVQLH
jgi:hypothetical protein